jgi:hypothetical protein
MGAFYQDIKNLIQGVTAVPKDILHIYGGFIAFLVWMLLFRGRKKLLGIALISLSAVANEIMDLQYHARKAGNMNWQESFSDISHTVLIPVLLLLFLHYFYEKRR